MSHTITAAHNNSYPTLPGPCLRTTHTLAGRPHGTDITTDQDRQLLPRPGAKRFETQSHPARLLRDRFPASELISAVLDLARSCESPGAWSAFRCAKNPAITGLCRSATASSLSAYLVHIQCMGLTYEVPEVLQR